MADMQGNISEQESIAYIRTLYDMERMPDHDKATIVVGPYTAFIMISALQLVTRHPNLSDGQLETVKSIIDQMRPMFAGTTGGQLLQLGDDPANDRGPLRLVHSD